MKQTIGDVVYVKFKGTIKGVEDRDIGLKYEIQNGYGDHAFVYAEAIDQNTFPCEDCGREFPYEEFTLTSEKCRECREISLTN